MRDWNELYTRYLRKQCNPDEILQLLEHFRLEGQGSELHSRILDELANTDIPASDTPETEAAFGRIQQRLLTSVSETTFPAPRTNWFRWLSAAAAVLLVSLITFWFFDNGRSINHQAVAINAADIGPGGNRATLTLTDGRTISLSEDQSGITVGNNISYLDGTEVVANTSEGPTVTAEPLMLKTPKGGIYQLTLADGTRVWLNSASTLKYPAHFMGKERVVELEGEAYFEVTSQRSGTNTPRIPFRVVSAGQTVEVLGTQFNIAAYADESTIKTTLVEGSVEITNLQSGITDRLQPGEQATTQGTTTQKQQVDVDQFIAWKDGLFSFRETELRQVMSQLSRWYDITISYQGGVPVTHYYGAISRSESLAGVLDLLQQSGLNFRIEKIGTTNKLTVLP